MRAAECFLAPPSRWSHSGTRAFRTAVTDERGAFTFTSLFPDTVNGIYVENSPLYVPPNAYHVEADAFYDTRLGGTGLTYDTVHLIPLTALLGTQVINTPTPRSFTSCRPTH